MRGDRGQGPLRDLPRRRREVLRPGGLLDDAAQELWRRPGGHLQGLLRLGEGLDRDQGLIGLPGSGGGSHRHEEEAGGPQALRLPLAAPAGPARPSPVAARWPGFSWPTWGRWRCCSWPRCGSSTTSAARSCTRRASRTSRSCRDPGLPQDRGAHRDHRRRGDRHRRAARLPDRVLHGQGGHAAGASHAGGGGADAALVELPGEGLLLADHAGASPGS